MGLIHRSAWKVNSANVVCQAFYEVPLPEYAGFSEGVPHSQPALGLSVPGIVRLPKRTPQVARAAAGARTRRTPSTRNRGYVLAPCVPTRPARPGRAPRGPAE